MGEIVIGIVYFLVGLLSSIFGSIAGIGGGIIIKPVLDLFGNFDVATISILSAVTVFSMTTVSVIIMFFNSNINIQLKTSGLLAFSSIIGGVTGKSLFNILLKNVSNKALLSLTQSVILTLLMIVIFIYQRHKHSLRTFELHKIPFILWIGFLLGSLAAFLGIGGGPFNVAVLLLGFSMAAKEAAVNSMFIIFFSQSSSLITTSITTGFAPYDLSLLPFIATGGVVGGIIGSTILSKVSNKHVDLVYTLGLLIVILINIVNIVKVLPSI